MHVSLFLCLLFSLFSTCFCSMCVLSNWQTDWCGDVSSFPLSSFSLHFSSHHSLRHLWRLWLKSERERQRTKEKAGSRRERKISFALAKNSAGQWTKEEWAVEMGALRQSEMFLFNFFLLTMWAVVEMSLSLWCTPRFQCRLLPHLTHSWLSACRLFFLKLLPYCCLRPKILLPSILFALHMK